MNLPQHTALLGFALPLIGLALAAIGLIAWRRGQWPARVGDTLHCPRCDYILNGLTPGSRCPECGADVSGARAVRGERHRRAGLTWFGRLVLLLGLALIGLAFSGTLRNVDWYHYRPTAWVIKDLGGTDFPRAVAELQRRAAAGALSAEQQADWERQLLRQLDTANSGPAAWAQLQSRAAAGTLAPANRDAWVRRQIADLDRPAATRPDRAWVELQRLMSGGHVSPADRSALVERSMRAQAGPFTSLNALMLDWLGQQCVAHALTVEQEQRFLGGMQVVQLEVRPRVGPHDRVPYVIRESGRGPSDWWGRTYFVGIFVDDRDTGTGGGGGSGSIGGSTVGSSLDPQTVGPHRLRVTLSTGVDPQHHDGDARNAKLLFERAPELTADFDVLPEAPPVKRVARPAAAVMAACLRAEQFEVRNDGYHKLNGEIYYDHLPANVGFAAFARVDGKEYPLGSITEPAGPGRGGVSVGLRALPPGALQKIDVVLRSDPSVARQTVDLDEIWDGEIVLHDVPVTHPTTRPAR